MSDRQDEVRAGAGAAVAAARQAIRGIGDLPLREGSLVTGRLEG